MVAEPAVAAVSRGALAQPRTGGRIVVDALKTNGVEAVFCVPGESYLPILDAMREEPSIRLISCRHESGAANMAEAYGKLTGRPGILMVTRGPGTCNATIGLHTAFQDSTPLVAFVGDVDRGFEDREAFQEIDFCAFLRPVCKWVGRVQSTDRLPELISRAFHTAMAGRPGPVALVVPEDMLAELATVTDVPPAVRVQPAPLPSDIERLGTMLREAQRPIVIAGGAWTEQASEDIVHFAEAHDLPVAVSFRAQDRIDNTKACYVGDVGIGISPALASRIAEADLILAIGPRLGNSARQGG